MTKATMPEPVAEVCSGYTLHWAGSGPIAPLCERTGAKVGSLLITTTQAEAYAAARVRAALEELAALARQKYAAVLSQRVVIADGEDDDRNMEIFNVGQLGQALAYSAMEGAIRALMSEQ